MGSDFASLQAAVGASLAYTLVPDSPADQIMFPTLIHSEPLTACHQQFATHGGMSSTLIHLDPFQCQHFRPSMHTSTPTLTAYKQVHL